MDVKEMKNQVARVGAACVVLFVPAYWSTRALMRNPTPSLIHFNGGKQTYVDRGEGIGHPRELSRYQ